ncbi:MAG TPA: hypothetical protein PKO09_00100 [Anaerolineae bacterium]|nr:hypothetical protein [Anaerolineae bacterium]
MPQRWRMPNLTGHTLATALLCVTALVWLVLLFGKWGFDDPYVTYRYADNILSGRGLVYNTGEETLSTVSPLYALVLAGLGLLFPDVPTVSNWISILSVVASALVLMRWGASRCTTGGWIAGLLLLSCPLVHQTTGLERSLLMLLALAGLYAFDRSRLAVAAGVLSLAGILRPEGLLVGLVVAISLVVRRRAVPWRFVLLYLAPIAAWYGALWLFTGSLLPTNLAAKQQQAQMSGAVGYFAGFLRLLGQYARHPLYWLHGVLALVGLQQVLSRARHWGLLLAWTALYFVGYSVLAVSPYFWYYATLAPAVLVLVSEGAAGVIRSLVSSRVPRLAATGLAGGLVMCLLAPPLAGTLTTTWRPDPRLQAYREIGEWLRAETPASATVGTLEVGIIGYYSERTMIDFSGLVQPAVSQQLTAAGTFAGSTRWAIERFWPDYVVLDRSAFADLPASGWFSAAYTPVGHYPGLGALWLTVYQRSAAQ